MKTLLPFVVVALGLIGMAACLPATKEAGVRRMQAYQLERCVKGNHCAALSQCFAESRARCRAAGLEASCGQMEQEGSCDDDTQRRSR